MPDNNETFHEGEIAIQKKMGVAESMAEIGSRVFRDYMPTQHRDFFHQLPMIFVGFSDENKDIWASVIAGEPGFVTSENDKLLTINQWPLPGDPLNQVLINAGQSGRSARFGFLGIELATRRRNRLNGQLNSVSDFSFSVSVVQSFGNCPKYIQTRRIKDVVRPEKIIIEHIDVFSPEMTSFIKNADTFFVASSSVPKISDTFNASDGADVSHRGGQAGFIRVDDEKTLTIPDYIGNNFFNTLGNIQVNSKTGLLFIDFEVGDVYMLTGSAKILWDDADIDDFSGAERLWQFTLSKGYKLVAALPWRFVLDEWSPYSLMTGTWVQVTEKRENLVKTNNWNYWTIAKTVNESHLIRSFYFTLPNGQVPQFLPGQHLTLKVRIDGKDYIRNYSLSSAPQDNFLRISVKREGKVSNFLHDKFSAGAKLNIKPPQGSFQLAHMLNKPVVLIGAGVGITPMISMFRFIVNEAIMTGKRRTVLLIAAFNNEKDAVFQQEINQLCTQAGEFARVVWFLSQWQSTAVSPATMQGRVNRDFLAKIIEQGKQDYYLCGPGGFMQQMYNDLTGLGVDDGNIRAEAFGPAAIKRAAADHPLDPPPSQSAIVRFDQTQSELIWKQSEGSLLEFAESHGITPVFGCRIGACGSCKVKIKKGTVTHNNGAKIALAKDEALLCCAMPVGDKVVLNI